MNRTIARYMAAASFWLAGQLVRLALRCNEWADPPKGAPAMTIDPTDEAPKKKVPTYGKLLYIALPLATLITFAVLLFAGGVEQVGDQPRMLSYVLELAPRTLFVLAIGGSTVLAMHIFGMNLRNAYRLELIKRVADNCDLGAFLVLAGETVAVLAWAWLIGRMFLVWQG